MGDLASLVHAPAQWVFGHPEAAVVMLLSRAVLLTGGTPVRSLNAVAERSTTTSWSAPFSTEGTLGTPAR